MLGSQSKRVKSREETETDHNSRHTQEKTDGMQLNREERKRQHKRRDIKGEIEKQSQAEKTRTQIVEYKHAMVQRNHRQSE